MMFELLAVISLQFGNKLAEFGEMVIAIKCVDPSSCEKSFTFHDQALEMGEKIKQNCNLDSRDRTFMTRETSARQRIKSEKQDKSKYLEQYAAKSSNLIK
jgi:hypothetical protein